MKLTAIKTITVGALSKDKVDADGKPVAVNTTYGPGQDFDVPNEVGQRLLDRGKAGKQGTVEIPPADAPQEIPAESAQKPVDPKRK